MKPGCRSVCIREVQKSIEKSSMQLIKDRIVFHGLENAGCIIRSKERITPGGGAIIFQGMQDHTSDSIKSLEGFDTAWVEEAQTLSRKSLKDLRPTIRGPGSELWFTWNPRRKTDAVDELFRGEEIPSDAVVVRANHDDNPWFPDELEQERVDCLRMNPDGYDHIWEGGYITIADGAYYAKHLAIAKKESRIGVVSREALMCTYAFWDIGGTGAKADACAIWIIQFIGKEVRVLNYYEAQGQELSEHVGWLRREGYEETQVYLPHDGVKHDGVFKVSFQSELKKAGFDVTVVPNAGAGAANQRVEATRKVFPHIWFDKAKCQPGIEALGWYHEKKDEDRGIGLGPEHDWASHGADAFGMMAMEYDKITRGKRPSPADKRRRMNMRDESGGWMGG